MHKFVLKVSADNGVELVKARNDLRVAVLGPMDSEVLDQLAQFTNIVLTGRVLPRSAEVDLLIMDFSRVKMRALWLCNLRRKYSVLLLIDKPSSYQWSGLLRSSHIDGFLLKTSAPKLLRKAISTVITGRHFCDPEIDYLREN